MLSWMEKWVENLAFALSQSQVKRKRATDSALDCFSFMASLPPLGCHCLHERQQRQLKRIAFALSQSVWLKWKSNQWMKRISCCRSECNVFRYRWPVISPLSSALTWFCLETNNEKCHSPFDGKREETISFWPKIRKRNLKNNGKNRSTKGELQIEVDNKKWEEKSYFEFQ